MNTHTTPLTVITPADGCPACGSHKRQTALSIKVSKCQNCGCLQGTVYLGESHTLVRPHWCGVNGGNGCTGAEVKPYDLTTLGSKGIGRRHGWYCTGCKGIVQTG